MRYFLAKRHHGVNCVFISDQIMDILISLRSLNSLKWVNDDEAPRQVAEGEEEVGGGSIEVVAVSTIDRFVGGGARGH